jgi:multiple sugar transport system ATP-binding protein
MGRAIVREPQAFLFDEPLSNLDAKLRAEMRTEIKRLHAQLKTTVVYVTHDQVEAMTLADRIVVLKDGVVEQVGTPGEIYSSPRTQFVAAFMGAPPMNLMPVELHEGSMLELASGAGVPVPARYADAARARGHGSLLLGMRPEHIMTGKALAETGAAALTCPVSVIEPLGSDTLVFLVVGQQEVVARVMPALAPRPGDSFTIGLDPANLHLFDGQTGENLLNRAQNIGPAHRAIESRDSLARPLG